MPETFIVTKENKQKPEKIKYQDYENYSVRQYNKIAERIIRGYIIGNEKYVIGINQKGEGVSKFVDNYINRESIILTCIGIVIGLIAGVFLTGFVISTCETENMRFARNILLHSYIYSILITSVFSIIVNFATHFVLKKINMVESLKSIE